MVSSSKSLSGIILSSSNEWGEWNFEFPLTFSLYTWACFEILLIFIFVFCCNVCYVRLMMLFLEVNCGSLKRIGFWLNFGQFLLRYPWACLGLFVWFLLFFLMQWVQCWKGNVLCRAYTLYIIWMFAATDCFSFSSLLDFIELLDFRH